MKKQLLADHQKHTPYNKNECADTFCGLQIFAERNEAKKLLQLYSAPWGINTTHLATFKFMYTINTPIWR